MIRRRSPNLVIALSTVAVFHTQPDVALCGSDKIEHQKMLVGYKSVEKFVKDNMIIGMGTGTTTYFATERIGQLLKSGKLSNVKVVPCSEKTKNQCIGLSIPIASLSECPHLDLFIDGADEVSFNLSLIKGGSGAFLREKMVQKACKRRIIVIDGSKLTKNLGPGSPVPVEVIPFSSENTRRVLEENLPSIAGCRALLRRGKIDNTYADGIDPAVTDNGNFIIDLYFEKPIADISVAISELDSTPGVVGHGLFINTVNRTTVMVATDKGIRYAGEEGEEPWWEEHQTKKPIDRISVDNRRPIDLQSSNGLQ